LFATAVEEEIGLDDAIVFFRAHNVQSVAMFRYAANLPQMRIRDRFNFHAEQSENKAIQVKDHSSSLIAIRTDLLREPVRLPRNERLGMEGPQDRKARRVRQLPHAVEFGPPIKLYASRHFG
jgi:hypothetical protein